MLYKFRFKGGVERDTNRKKLDKFLMFFVIHGKETPFYKMKKEGLIQCLANENLYKTNFNIIKIFIAQSGFGPRKRYLSFYIRLTKDIDLSPSIEIRPFNTETGFYFKGRGIILTREEVKDKILDPVSLNYYLQQSPLPKEIMDRIITIDASYLKKGVRTIRIKRRD